MSRYVLVLFHVHEVMPGDKEVTAAKSRLPYQAWELLHGRASHGSMQLCKEYVGRKGSMECPLTGAELLCLLNLARRRGHACMRWKRAISTLACSPCAGVHGQVRGRQREPAPEPADGAAGASRRARAASSARAPRPTPRAALAAAAAGAQPAAPPCFMPNLRLNRLM